MSKKRTFRVMVDVEVEFVEEFVDVEEIQELLTTLTDPDEWSSMCGDVDDLNLNLKSISQNVIILP